MTPDPVAQIVFENMEKVDTFFREVFYENPVNNMRTQMRSYVHAYKAHNNAYWAPLNCRDHHPSQTEAVHFGDVDHARYASFALSLDIVAHEFGHSIVSSSASFGGAREDNFESGALNESIADVFAIMVKHYQTKILANHPDASWLIGEGFRVGADEGTSLRSLKAPGTAYRNHCGMSDNQPRHYVHYKRLEADQEPSSCDNGYSHHNCGIPNHAFYLAATGIGGFTYGEVGKIWHRALMSAKRNDTFSAFALRTLRATQDLGYNHRVYNAVGRAWLDVGVDLRGQFPLRGIHPVPLKDMYYYISRQELAQLDANIRERVNQAFRANLIVGVRINTLGKTIYSLDRSTLEHTNPPLTRIGHIRAVGLAEQKTL